MRRSGLDHSRVDGVISSGFIRIEGEHSRENGGMQDQRKQSNLEAAE